MYIYISCRPERKITMYRIYVLIYSIKFFKIPYECLNIFFMIFKKVCKLKQDALSMYQSFGKTLKTMFWFFRLISCNEEKITGWALKFSIHTLERIPILTLSCSVKQWYQIIIVALYKYVVFPIWLNLSA